MAPERHPYPDFFGTAYPDFPPDPNKRGGKNVSARAVCALDFLRAGPKPRERLLPRPIPGQGARLRRREVRILRPVNTERAEMRPPAGSHLHASTRPTPQSIDSATRHGILCRKGRKGRNGFANVASEFFADFALEKGVRDVLTPRTQRGRKDRRGSLRPL